MGLHGVMIDVSQASLSPDVASRTPEIGPLYLKDGEPLHLRVFVDRSVIDVFSGPGPGVRGRGQLY